MLIIKSGEITELRLKKKYSNIVKIKNDILIVFRKISRLNFSYACSD